MGRIAKPTKKSYRDRIKSLEKKLDLAWSFAVRNRDKVCQKCLKTPHISAHHAFGRRHESTRYDLMNGVGLCYFCHIQWAHRDSAGFTEWFKNRIGEDQYSRLAECHRMPALYKEEDLLSILSNIQKESNLWAS